MADQLFTPLLPSQGLRAASTPLSWRNIQPKWLVGSSQGWAGSSAPIHDTTSRQHQPATRWHGQHPGPRTGGFRPRPLCPRPSQTCPFIQPLWLWGLMASSTFQGFCQSGSLPFKRRADLRGWSSKGWFHTATVETR